jgi:hypothetical protein
VDQKQLIDYIASLLRDDMFLIELTDRKQLDHETRRLISQLFPSLPTYIEQAEMIPEVQADAVAIRGNIKLFDESLVPGKVMFRLIPGIDTHTSSMLAELTLDISSIDDNKLKAFFTTILGIEALAYPSSMHASEMTIMIHGLPERSLFAMRTAFIHPWELPAGCSGLRVENLTLQLAVAQSVTHTHWIGSVQLGEQIGQVSVSMEGAEGNRWEGKMNRKIKLSQLVNTLCGEGEYPKEYPDFELPDASFVVDKKEGRYAIDVQLIADDTESAMEYPGIHLMVWKKDEESAAWVYQVEVQLPRSWKPSTLLPTHPELDSLSIREGVLYASPSGLYISTIIDLYETEALRSWCSLLQVNQLSLQLHYDIAKRGWFAAFPDLLSQIKIVNQIHLRLLENYSALQLELLCSIAGKEELSFLGELSLSGKSDQLTLHLADTSNLFSHLPNVRFTDTRIELNAIEAPFMYAYTTLRIHGMGDIPLMGPILFHEQRILLRGSIDERIDLNRLLPHEAEALSGVTIENGSITIALDSSSSTDLPFLLFSGSFTCYGIRGEGVLEVGHDLSMKLEGEFESISIDGSRITGILPGTGPKLLLHTQGETIDGVLRGWVNILSFVAEIEVQIKETGFEFQVDGRLYNTYPVTLRGYAPLTSLQEAEFHIKPEFSKEFLYDMQQFIMDHAEEVLVSETVGPLRGFLGVEIPPDEVIHMLNSVMSLDAYDLTLQLRDLNQNRLKINVGLKLPFHQRQITLDFDYLRPAQSVQLFLQDHKSTLLGPIF